MWRRGDGGGGVGGQPYLATGVRSGKLKRERESEKMERGRERKRAAVMDDHADLRIFQTQPCSPGSPCPTAGHEEVVGGGEEEEEGEERGQRGRRSKRRKKRKKRRGLRSSINSPASSCSAPLR